MVGGKPSQGMLEGKASDRLLKLMASVKAEDRLERDEAIEYLLYAETYRAQLERSLPKVAAQINANQVTLDEMRRVGAVAEEAKAREDAQVEALLLECEQLAELIAATTKHESQLEDRSDRLVEEIAASTQVVAQS